MCRRPRPSGASLRLPARRHALASFFAMFRDERARGLAVNLRPRVTEWAHDERVSQLSRMYVVKPIRTLGPEFQERLRRPARLRFRPRPERPSGKPRGAHAAFSHLTSTTRSATAAIEPAGRAWDGVGLTVTREAEGLMTRLTSVLLGAVFLVSPAPTAAQGRGVRRSRRPSHGRPG